MVHLLPHTVSATRQQMSPKSLPRPRPDAVLLMWSLLRLMTASIDGIADVTDNRIVVRGKSVGPRDYRVTGDTVKKKEKKRKRGRNGFPVLWRLRSWTRSLWSRVQSVVCPCPHFPPRVKMPHDVPLFPPLAISGVDAVAQSGRCVRIAVPISGK